jgi:hypothetical protein
MAVQLTKKHKIYLGVAAIGLVCLLVDRFVLRGGAASADAAPAVAVVVKPKPEAPTVAQNSAPAAAPVTGPSHRPARPMVPAAAAEAPASSSSTAVIVDRLKAVAQAQGLDGSTPVTDAFRPSPTWVPPKPDKSATPDAAPLETREQLFVRTHTLTAVVVGRNGFALVDGKLLRVGQELEGFRLVSVDKKSATFAGNEGGGSTATLPLVESVERRP